MDDLLSLNLAVSNSIDIFYFSISMIGAGSLSYLVSLHYQKYFPHISGSVSMSKTIFTIATITFLIISVVKSSLALSLGLVGALSIIRFRTPIKEPFELSYLFMSIGIGLGFGAQQFFPTIIVIIFILFILSILTKNKNKFFNNSYHIYMTLREDILNNSIESYLSDLSKKINSDIILKRIDQNDDSIQITLNVKIDSKDELLNINKKLKEIFSPKSMSIVDNQKLMPF